MERLKRRADYRAVARGKRVSRPGFLIQALEADPGDRERPARFGFTVTKKIGSAVVRNRIRRRLKEAVRLAGMGDAAPGTDYVLIGRRAALTLPFDRLTADLVSGIVALSPDGAAEDRSRHA